MMQTGVVSESNAGILTKSSISPAHWAAPKTTGNGLAISAVTSRLAFSSASILIANILQDFPIERVQTNEAARMKRGGKKLEK